MTAHMTSGDYEHCLAAGMDGCITKPFQSEDLLSILEKQLEPTDGAIAVKNADNPAAPRQPWRRPESTCRTPTI